MPGVLLVTGSSGLIGSEVVEYFAGEGWTVHGIDNNMRADSSGSRAIRGGIASGSNAPTCCLRGGCLTGPNHSGVELHGFLSYLIQCNVEQRTYRVYGYKGKQVRDNIHSYDVMQFVRRFIEAPRVAEVYNLGGGRAKAPLMNKVSNISSVVDITTPNEAGIAVEPQLDMFIC